MISDHSKINEMLCEELHVDFRVPHKFEYRGIELVSGGELFEWQGWTDGSKEDRESLFCGWKRYVIIVNEVIALYKNIYLGAESDFECELANPDLVDLLRTHLKNLVV